MCVHTNMHTYMHAYICAHICKHVAPEQNATCDNMIPRIVRGIHSSYKPSRLFRSGHLQDTTKTLNFHVAQIFKVFKVIKLDKCKRHHIETADLSDAPAFSFHVSGDESFGKLTWAGMSL